MTADRKPMPRMLDRTCANPACGQAFQARAADVNRGQGNFCSRACAKAPRIELKPREEIESWMQTAHTGARWWEVMQYQRTEIDELRAQLAARDALIEQLNNERTS